MKLNELVDKCRTAATNVAGINGFDFDLLSTINENRAKAYPRVLMKVMPSVYDPFHEDNTGDYERHSMNVFLFQLYDRGTEDNNDLEDEYTDAQALAREWLKELFDPALSEDVNGAKLYRIVDEIVSVERGHFEHVDRLLAVKLSFQLTVFAGC